MSFFNFMKKYPQIHNCLKFTCIYKSNELLYTILNDIK